MTATVPCDVIRAMPPAGRHGARHRAAKDGKQAALQRAVRQRHDAQRVDITDRNVVVASMPRARCSRTRMPAHRDHLVRGRHLRHVRRADRSDRPRKELRTGFADPNLRPDDRRRLHRPDRPCAAGALAVGDDRHPIHHHADGVEARRDAAGHGRDRHRARRAVAAGPARRPPDAAAHPAAMAHVLAPPTSSSIGGFLLWHVIGANSSDDGYILQMARVAGHAGYMSNYFRWFGSPEDPFGWYYNLLALMTDVSDASIWMRLPDLVCALVCWLLAVSRGAAPTRARGRVEQARGVGGGPGAAGRVDAVQQRTAARGADRHRRADHLRAHRAGHHLRPA